LDGYVAPPLFFTAFIGQHKGQGYAGVHAWAFPRDQWEFYKPILEGDYLYLYHELVDVSKRQPDGRKNSNSIPR